MERFSQHDAVFFEFADCKGVGRINGAMQRHTTSGTVYSWIIHVHAMRDYNPSECICLDGVSNNPSRLKYSHLLLPDASVFAVSGEYILNWTERYKHDPDFTLYV